MNAGKNGALSGNFKEGKKGGEGALN